MHNFLGIFLVFGILAAAHAYRLPETVHPSRYMVDLFIPEDVFTGKNLTFEGEKVWEKN